MDKYKIANLFRDVTKGIPNRALVKAMRAIYPASLPSLSYELSKGELGMFFANFCYDFNRILSSDLSLIIEAAAKAKRL